MTDNSKSTLCKKSYQSDFKKEFKSFMELYLPILFTNAFKFLNPMVSVIMCGKLSKFEFDASGLANSIIFMLGLTIDLGFSSAFDTLFSQIYGSGQKKKMGLLYQKAIIIITLVYLVLACIHLNIEPILILLKQDPLVSQLTAQYLTIYLPGLYFEFQFLTMSRYLQNQNIVIPMMLSALIGNIFNSIGQYISICILKNGIEASAFVQGSANVVMFLVQLGYLLISGIYKETWAGFSFISVFMNWKIIFILGIPGIFMLGLELWSLEAATFIAGSLGTIQLGAQSVAFQCCYLSYMITSGMGSAVTIRVGQYVGSKEINRLKTFLRAVTSIGVCTSTFNFLIMINLRKQIASLFSADLDIQNEASILLILIALLQFLDVIIVVTSGILKATGRQFISAVVMFICFYIIGNPIGLLLIYVAKLKMKGMWVGLETALFLEALIFSILVYRTNWEKECDKAEVNTEYFDIQKEENELMPPTANEKDSQRLRKILIKKIAIIVVVVILFFLALMMHIYINKSLYLSCIQVTNETVELRARQPNLFCQV